MCGMNEVDALSPQERMIRQQIMDRGIADARVLTAMRAVPRDQFLPEDMRDVAFSDRAAPIGHDQTISQPYIVALMSTRLELQATSRVLEIGTGCGYQTAILARLAGKVYTVERIKPLLDEAWERLMSMNLRNIHFRHGDGTRGWPEEAPFDRILIGAAAHALPRKLLLDQLIDGGQAVLPYGEDGNQVLAHVRRKGEELVVSDICPCRFVELVEGNGI
jgi:protein-L-isoaspartate(D-aspartate) O-methyltransferase